MKIANLSIRRPVTITMIMIAVVIVGIFSVFQLPEELYPKLNLPVAAVATSWTGASPEAVEQQVTDPIEQGLQGLSGVSQIQSTSTQGSSLVIVEFNYGTDIDEALNEMRSIVSRTQGQLPSNAGTPGVEQFDPNSLPIMTLSLYGNQSQQAISDVATNIVQPALQHLNGVAGVTPSGNLTRQITVNVQPDKLQLYHLSIEQVVQALQGSNLSADAGQVQKGSLLIPLRVNGQFSSVDELNDVPISLAGGGTISLKDVADVDDGDKTVTMISTVNGQPAVTLDISQASDANTVTVSNEVQSEVKQLQSQLPQGVHLSVLSDSAQSIRDTINTVVNHTILGFVFGILVILLILRSIRTTVVVAVAIPIATLATFALMYFSNLSINSITLGSLAVGLGSLVDFSIVVLESIFRARQTGIGPVEAARQGTKEVGLAVVVAALAQICVFAPSIFVPGIAGQFFRPLSLTVSFSHIAALFVALTFTPMLASRLLRGRRFEGEETIPGKTAPFRAWAPFDWMGRGMYDLTRAYRRVLQWSLNHRKSIIFGATAMLVLSFALVPSIGFELVPNVGDNQISISIQTADGTDLQSTNQVVQQVEKLAKQDMKGIVQVNAEIGGASYGATSSTNQATVNLTFANSVSSNSVNQMAHDFGGVVSDIPGAQILVTPGSANGSGPGSNSITVQIQGPDNQTLQILSDQVEKIMKATPGLEYVDNQTASGTPDYQLNINQAALAQFGLSAQQVESTLQTAFQGTKASTFFQGSQQYDIVVQLPSSFSQNLNNLSQVQVENNSGQFVPVTQLGSLTTSQEPPQISHVNGVRSVTVSATPYGATSGRVQATLGKELKSLHVPQGYYVGFGQNGAFMTSAFVGLAAAFGFSILLLYMLMASLFEALLTPLVIMFCLPPTFIGAALGLFLTHRSLNIDSAIGVIMVMGLIANNAIVLIDYTNHLRKQGRPLREALLEAGPIRLRPIVMSTLTTILAMMPLVIGYGKGAETLASMATVIAFGLAFSTLVTLVLVPVVYVMLDNWISRFKHRRGKKRGPSIPTTGTGLGV
ncbi:efflux RND transporter permease subunit [Alicyclobacillus fastidiosus]|uniref:Efflux RND transporter permease subunit n=1 Tax=Alicyclobacillus fastidiosus TaxID=392011 RepID=A0ABY6ZGR1_9BACL|nr:efflux RND transporter permease subunit [Alicyclobacillus fastidiosus]WAH41778.1 efflux RND transporter permease subunit [Alicyclobacillus fastidiosus]GMA63472.1 multidrug ABC transporter [Alicyclobacillus fastidiosus]